MNKHMFFTGAFMLSLEAMTGFAYLVFKTLDLSIPETIFAVCLALFNIAAIALIIAGITREDETPIRGHKY